MVVAVVAMIFGAIYAHWTAMVLHDKLEDVLVLHLVPSLWINMGMLYHYLKVRMVGPRRLPLLRMHVRAAGGRESAHLSPTPRSLSACVCVRACVCIHVCVCLCLSVCLPACLSVCLSVWVGLICR